MYSLALRILHTSKLFVMSLTIFMLMNFYNALGGACFPPFFGHCVSYFVCSKITWSYERLTRRLTPTLWQDSCPTPSEPSPAPQLEVPCPFLRIFTICMDAKQFSLWGIFHIVLSIKAQPHWADKNDDTRRLRFSPQNKYENLAVRCTFLFDSQNDINIILQDGL